MRTGDEARTEVTPGRACFIYLFIYLFAMLPHAGSQFLDQRKNPRLPVEARSLNHWTAREDPRGLRLSVLPGPRSLPRGPALQQTLPELMATESGGGILGQRTEGYQGHGRGALHSLIELSLHLVSSSAK